MSAVEELLAAESVVADYRRDRWDRPLIVPAGGGKAIGYTRASGAAKVIEDTFGLDMWARRNVAYGLALDASLVARVLAVGGNPSTWDDASKKEIARVVEDAAAVAQAHKAANIGTAVHRLTERADGSRTVVSHLNKSHKGRLARALVSSRAEPSDAAGVARVAARAGLRVELTGEHGLVVLTDEAGHAL